MKRSGVLAVVAVLVVAVAAWFWLRSGSEQITVDLVNTFSAAQKRPSAESFTSGPVTIAGVTKESIQPREPSRITYTQVTVPQNGSLKVSLALLEQGWTMDGDGVMFRIGVSTGGRYDELLNIMRNPFANPNDRNWHDVTVDLSEYAGEKVDLVFNTNSSAPGGDNRNGDFPVWGAPRIVVD